LRREIISHLLRELPKSLRRALLPLEEKVADIVAEFQPQGDFFSSLAAFLSKKFWLEIPGNVWPENTLPPHLQPRLAVADAQGNAVLVTRNLEELKSLTQQTDVRSPAWDRAVAQWESFELRGWTCGDLPERLTVETLGGVPLYAYPGLALREGAVDVRLFREAAEAEALTPAALRALAETCLTKEIAWLKRELSALRPLGQVATPAPNKPRALPGNSFAGALNSWASQQNKPSPALWCTAPQLQLAAEEHLLAFCLRLSPLRPLAAHRFEEMLANTRQILPTLLHKLKTLCAEIFALREKIVMNAKTYEGWQNDLQRLLPGDFLAKTPHAQLGHVPRYLKAMLLRADRADLHAAKDREKAERLFPFENWQKNVPATEREEFRWMLEEYRVSIFAPELGTAQPVSEKRLLERMR
jgi:ATP-dependent helicase HrpA